MRYRGKNTQRKDVCNDRCRNALPHRAAYCRCRCGGQEHGGLAIDGGHLFELADRKLRTRGLSELEHKRWERVIHVLGEALPRATRRRRA